MRLHKLAFVTLLFAGLILAAPVRTQAQVNTVNLAGTVLDPQGLAVKGATITLKNNANGAEKKRDEQRKAGTKSSACRPACTQ